MKKMIAMILAALALGGALTACGEEMPTPDAMFETIHAAEDVRMEMVIRYDDNIQTSTTVIEEDGDRTRVYMKTESFGAASDDEYFVSKEDGKQYLYVPTPNGEWKKEVLGEWFAPASVGGMAGLFNPDLYYAEEGGYTMYKTATVELDGMTFKDAKLEIVDEQTYRVNAVVSRKIDELEVYGSVTVTFTLKDLTVTLPKVN